MIFRIMIVVLLVLSFYCLGSLHSRLLVVLALGLIIIEEYRVFQSKNIVLCLVCISVLLYCFAFPKRSPAPTDELQSIYLSEEQKEVRIPWVPYLSNIVSEIDGLKFAVLAMKIIPEQYIRMGVSSSGALRYSPALADLVALSKEKSVRNNSLLDSSFSMQRTPSNLFFQTLQSAGFYSKLSHYYIVFPKDRPLSDCEITVFCHGLMGSWLAYPQLFRRYSKDIVVFVETKNLSGIFRVSDMRRITQNILPAVYRKYDLGNKKPHLVGLSNGSSAVNFAIKEYPEFFASYTIISGPLRTEPRIDQKVLLLHGDQDTSARISWGIDDTLYTKKVFVGEDHALLMSRPAEVFKELMAVR